MTISDFVQHFFYHRRCPRIEFFTLPYLTCDSVIDCKMRVTSDLRKKYFQWCKLAYFLTVCYSFVSTCSKCLLCSCNTCITFTFFFFRCTVKILQLNNTVNPIKCDSILMKLKHAKNCDPLIFYKVL